jgi:predicted Zn finger-like uncharacterized protein
MKIVCDACQAKYSIADEKIQGKAFKIRCKKCNHVIVVKVGADGAHVASSGERPRSTGSQAAVGAAEGQRISGSHAVAAAPASDAVWHVVVDGEQVGPLAESEIMDRLRQGKVNSDTLVWKEGFADWTQFSAVPELTPLLAKITRHPVKGAAREPARSTGQVKAVAAPVFAAPAVGTDPAEADPFAAPTVVSPAGTADLFAASVAPAAAPAATSPFLFGGGAAQPAEPVAPRSSGGNGASTTHLTGQRNENSVLFSLANLEALAMPAQSSNIRAPSASSNTEGSGLIDIRSMAAMTLGDAPAGPGRSADALPTFSTPQFSPVAPVILPLSTSGPPKWVYPVLVLLGIAMLAVGISIYKVVTAPPPGLPPPPPPAPPVVVPPAAPAAAPAPAAPAAGEPAKPSTEEKTAAPVAEDKGKGGSGKGPRKKSGETGKGTAEGKRGGETPGAAEPGKPGKKGRSIDDMLGEVGSKKPPAVEEAPKPPPPKLVALTTSDIVNAMKGVQPKVQNCANQFKQPGTASAQITVAAGGKVTSVTVTGKFAGTPTGSCVEAAAKSAKLPACQPMTFPWPFTLSPR